MIHGGGWRTGDKGSESQGRQKASFFTAHGFVYVSVNYRLSPEVQHPAHVEDVAKALAWIVDHIASYGGDPKQIFLMGHSAGAHLAALVTADEGLSKNLESPRRCLSGVILLDSAGYDIPRNLDDFSDSAYTSASLRRCIRKGQADMDPSLTHSVCPAREKSCRLSWFSTRTENHRKRSRKSSSKLFRRARIPAAAVLAKAKSHRALNHDIGRPDDGPSRLILEFLHGKDLKTFPPSI